MKLSIRQLGLVSVLCTALLGVVIWALYSEYDRPWKIYQQQFRQLNPGSSAKDNPARIKQIWNEELGAVDRCVTCHEGTDNPLFLDAGQPFKTHPGSYLKHHPVDKFGCVICHDGQGPALTADAAHGEVDNWPRPVLRGAFVQYSCIKCHKMEQLLSGSTAPDGASALIAGWRLFTQYNCSGCHRMSEVNKAARIGPSLTFIGNKVNRTWLINWLRNPGDYLPKTKMPRFNFRDEEIGFITDYLMSIRSSSRGVLQYAPTGHIRPSDALTAIEGKQLVSSLGCLGCHMINGNGSNFAPDFSDIGNKVNHGWLIQFLKAPRAYDPKTIIPDFKLSDYDAEKIAAYLVSLKKNTVIPATAGIQRKDWIPGLTRNDKIKTFPNRNDLLSDSITKGKKLVKDKGCTGCHEIERLPAVYNAPDLFKVGDKRIDVLTFGNINKIKKTLKDWMLVKVTDPGSFATDRIISRMPQFDFNDVQAEALVTYLLSLREDPIPPSYKMTVSGRDRLRYEAATVIDKYNCRGCHVIGTTGGIIGPDLSSEGRKSRPEWLFTFLKSPYKIRPLPMLKARMPEFNLSEREINTIIEYLSSLSDEPYPYNFETKKEIGREDIWNGEKLYQEIFACSGCHTVNGRGGQVGPDHTDLASRLKRDWIRQWLENPQAIKPDVSMPRFRFKDWELEALTDYLMTLGIHRFIDIKGVD
ncbi:MAG: hypothetical protein C4581_04335 [Nitrospiraceae bacterium]|nr:MAG: hypothetical protein C4581_04335 [Nitrospiraceae bacterium]